SVGHADGEHHAQDGADDGDAHTDDRRARHDAAIQNGAVRIQGRIFGPDDQAAVLDDVLVAGQAGRDHAHERVDDQEQNDRENADLDRLFEQVFSFQPGQPAADGVGVDHDANNP